MRDSFAIIKGKRALVTGDTGFKGSWLSLWLTRLGADVVGYALPPARPDAHFNQLSLDTLVHHVDGDIRDLPALTKVCVGFKPQFLFHLGAQALTRSAYEDPKLTFDVNVGGSLNVLEALRRTPGRPKALAGIARAAEVTGDRATARTQYTRLLDMWKSADQDRPELDAARRFLSAER